MGNLLHLGLGLDLLDLGLQLGRLRLDGLFFLSKLADTLMVFWREICIIFMGRLFSADIFAKPGLVLNNRASHHRIFLQIPLNGLGWCLFPVNFLDFLNSTDSFPQILIALHFIFLEI